MNINEQKTVPSFGRHLIEVSNFLSAREFQTLKEAAGGQVEGERVNIAGHKRGTTISYARLRCAAPAVIEFYRSPTLNRFISSIVGEAIEPTPLHDESSCSLLVYDRPGDRIGWHYDHNFYNGRHFTALLSLENRDSVTRELSNARLIVKDGNAAVTVPTPPNTFVLFEGAQIRHQVTALAKDERRVILSMTFCTDPSSTRLMDFERRVKDIAYFGLRALWRRS